MGIKATGTYSYKHPYSRINSNFNHFDIYILDSDNCSSSDSIIFTKLTF